YCLKQGPRHTEGVLPFEISCAIVLPPSLAIFFCTLFKLQMPKKYANRHYIIPMAAVQILLIGCS
uniref:Uncharacterized protein n=1 Tax=Moschus moschiferus TaxID=68415 RepID=A0A8C6DTR0_MOSMO